MKKHILFAACIVNLLAMLVTDKWLVIQVACVVLGFYALWRAFLEVLNRLAKLDEEHLS